MLFLSEVEYRDLAQSYMCSSTTVICEELNVTTKIPLSPLPVIWNDNICPSTAMTGGCDEWFHDSWFLLLNHYL